MKTIFVWENVYRGLTGNYHSGGGALVIADDIEKARELLKTEPAVDSDHCDVFKKDPSYTAKVMTDDDSVIIFPDAGCC